jgi:hypothetical protein
MVYNKAVQKQNDSVDTPLSDLLPEEGVDQVHVVVREVGAVIILGAIAFSVFSIEAIFLLGDLPNINFWYLLYFNCGLVSIADVLGSLDLPGFEELGVKPNADHGGVPLRINDILTHLYSGSLK